MTQCTKCKSCQIEEDESGQPALFCTACGGPVEVVSDELPFVYRSTITEMVNVRDNTVAYKVYRENGKIDWDALAVSLNGINEKS